MTPSGSSSSAASLRNKFKVPSNEAAGGDDEVARVSAAGSPRPSWPRVTPDLPPLAALATRCEHKHRVEHLGQEGDSEEDPKSSVLIEVGSHSILWTPTGKAGLPHFGDEEEFAIEAHATDLGIDETPDPPAGVGPATSEHLLALAALVMARRTWLVQRLRARIGRELRATLDPEDVLQDALVEGVAAAQRQKLASERSLQAWVLAVARNRIAEIARQSQPRSRPRRQTSLPYSLVSLGLPIEQEVDDAAVDALPSVVRQRELQERSRSLSALPAKQRLCVVLRDLMELPWESVAFAVGCSTDAAQKLHQRAQRRLARART